MIKDKHLLMAHLSVLLFGFSGLFGKLVYSSPVIIVFGRMFFAAITLAIVHLVLKQDVHLKKKSDIFAFSFLGLLFVLHSISFFWSIKISTVAIGLFSFSVHPVITTFLEPLFIREKLKFIDILIALGTLVGVFVLLPGFQLENRMTMGIIIGLISGVLFSLFSIFNRISVKKYSALTTTFLQEVMASLLLFPIVIASRFNPSLLDIVKLIVLGVIFTALSHLLYIKAMEKIKAQAIGIIASLEPVYATFFAFLILQESINSNTIIGGSVIVLMSLISSNEKAKNQLIKLMSFCRRRGCNLIFR